MAAGAKAGKQQLGEAAASAKAAGQAMQQGDMEQAIQRQNEAIRSLEQARQQVSRSELALTPASADAPFTPELLDSGLVSNAPEHPVPDEPPQHPLEVDPRFETFMNSLIRSPPTGYEKRLKDYTRYFRFSEKP